MADDLLLAVCDALTFPVAPLETTVRGDDTHAPWELPLDVNAAPVWSLPWLGAIVGEEWRGPATELLRAQIKDRPRFRRGTTASIKAAATATLTGTQEVRIIPRVDDDPNLLTVITKPAETPNPATTLRAMLRKTPVWVQLTYIVSDAPVIDALPNVQIDALSSVPIDQLTS